MEHSPSVLFISCTDEEPADYLIKLMLDELPTNINSEEGIISYPWHINTKYYEADILLSAMERKVLKSPSFVKTVHGIVMYFNSDESSSLNIMDEWLSFLNDYEVDIKIIVCPQCQEKPKDGISKREVQEWCLKRNFELVELNPLSDEDSDSDGDFAETTGISRISQALHANVWPNHTMKQRKEPTDMSGLLNGGRFESTGFAHDEMNGLTEDNIEPNLEELDQQEKLSFCTFFSQLASMKERASSLPSDERKKYAEKLVLTYWRAFGGEEDEILD